MNVYIVSEIDRGELEQNKVFKSEEKAIKYARELFQEVMEDNMKGNSEEWKDKIKEYVYESCTTSTKRRKSVTGIDDIFRIWNDMIEYDVVVFEAKVF